MYDFDKKIDRRNTDSIKWDTFQENNISEDTLPMFIADMDFAVLPEIQEALHRRIDQGVYGYTEQTYKYYQAIIDWMKNRHQWEVKKEWIVPTIGVVPALSMCILTYTNPGDAIIITTPVYGPFKAAIENNQRVCVSSSLINNDGHYEIDFADFEEKIINNHVRMFILCNPHNPCGRVWTKEELVRLTDICMKHHVLIVSDEIHQDFVFEPYTFTPVASVSEMAANYTITCTAPGKTFNLAGLQDANIIIKNERLRDAFKQTAGSLGIHGPNMIGAESCMVGYREGATWVDELVAYIKGNMDLVADFLASYLPNIKMTKQEGLYLAWIDFRALNMDDEALKDFLIKKAKVWPNAGAWFGQEGNGFARINLACPRAQVKQFLEQLYQAIITL